MATSACLQLFTYYLTLLSGDRHRRRCFNKARRDETETRRRESLHNDPAWPENPNARRTVHLKACHREDGAYIHLDDPYLSHLDLEDFPR